MRDGMPLLLGLLRDEVLDREPSALEWQQALQLAAEECVLPSLAAAVRRQAVTLSPEISSRLAEVDRSSAINTFWWTSELSGILKAFNGRQLPVILLKGPLLAQRLYGDVNLRSSRDLDLLVQPRHLEAAGAILSELGFRCNSRADDYHESWRRGTTLVELHHNVENPLAFRVKVEEFWKNSTEVEFCGALVHQLSPRDEILILCLHGVRHRFERLSHVLDLALAFRHLAPQLSPDAFRDRACAPLRPLVVLGNAMAQKLHPQLPGLSVGASAGELAHLHALADTRWQALLHEPSTPLDWQAQHLFYLETETTLHGRLYRTARHLLILTTRLIQEDFDVAARYHVRLPVLVWCVRQIRLLGKGLANLQSKAS